MRIEKKRQRKVDRVLANHSLSSSASQGTSNIPVSWFLLLGCYRQARTLFSSLGCYILSLFVPGLSSCILISTVISLALGLSLSLTLGACLLVLTSLSLYTVGSFFYSYTFRGASLKNWNNVPTDAWEKEEPENCYLAAVRLTVLR